VTRSEEELAVGVRTRVRRLRLRKYIVTEYVTRTIPVRREKVRLEELPTDQVLEGDGGDWADDADPAGTTQLELVLHREEPEIRLRPVPVERVRLVRRLVTEQRTVTGQLRKEQVELEEAPPGERPAPEGT
jgi:stress response protein YsnF